MAGVVVQELARALGTRAGIDSLVVSRHDILDGIALSRLTLSLALTFRRADPEVPGTLGVSGTFGSAREKISSRGIQAMNR